MEKTTNFSLNQWEPTDPIRRSDFNNDNAAIDAALKNLNTAVGSKVDQSVVAALQTAVTRAYSADNLPWEVGIISLSGLEDGAVAKTFDFIPSAILLGVNGANSGFAVNGKSTDIKSLTASAKHELTLSGNTLILDSGSTGLSSSLQYLALK